MSKKISVSDIRNLINKINITGLLTTRINGNERVKGTLHYKSNKIFETIENRTAIYNVFYGTKQELYYYLVKRYNHLLIEG